MNTNECTLAQLVDPEYPLNVVGYGGFRGGHMDQLKPLTVRVTDHADDLGGDQNDDTVSRLDFAIFESKAAGQPWKKVSQRVHGIHRNSATSEVRAFNRLKTMHLAFGTMVVGEEIGVFWQDESQPSPILYKYELASTDPVAEALAYATFLLANNAGAFEANIVDDGTVIELVELVPGAFTCGTLRVVGEVPADNLDVYYPDYNYTFFE